MGVLDDNADRSGWYIDGIVMDGLFDGRYTAPQGHACENGNSAAVSVETGFPFPLPLGSSSVRAQAQIVWQHRNFRNRPISMTSLSISAALIISPPELASDRSGCFQTDDGTRFTL